LFCLYGPRRERKLSLTPFPLIFTTKLEFDVFKAHDSGVVVVGVRSDPIVVVIVTKTIRIFLEDLNRGG
jgi:hypothetical protein